MSTPLDVKALLETGFDRVLVGLELVEIGEGRVRASVVVTEALQNFFGKLHGGAIATLVDDIGTVAVVTADRYRRAGVTTDLHVSYLAAAEAGETVSIDAEVLRCGLNLAFVEVTLRSELRGDVLARGRMTKLLTSDTALKTAR